MRNLNDPVLLAQCARIKEMIGRIAADPKHKDDYYAKNYHHWQLSPPARIEEIEEFEERACIELPLEYVYYLTQVGRGGACPGTYFSDFSANQRFDEEIAGTSEQLSFIMTEKDWEKVYGKHGDEPGTLDLCGMDLTYIAYLVINGPQRGRVVYLDYDGDMAPMWPKGSPDFLTWCENYYSELLAGYDIHPTWKFMWQEPGDEDALIQAFQNTPDLTYKEEVLFSFLKFPKLSDKARSFLQSLQNSKLQETIKKVIGQANTLQNVSSTKKHTTKGQKPLL